MQKLVSIFLIFFINSSYGYEIIRDPIFEDYFNNLQEISKFPHHNVYLIDSQEINAFVIDDSVYFTTEMLKNINQEETLKSIYFHEVGHIVNNHYSSKKVDIKKSNNQKIINNLLSIGIAIYSGNANIGIASNMSIDQRLMVKLSNKSIKYEIQADNFMLKMIEDNNINTKDLILFFNKLPSNEDNYFSTHPSHADRIIMLQKYNNNKEYSNSIIFEWLKSKYNKNSNISIFNEFFKNLENGLIIDEKLDEVINQNYINYEVYKSGINNENLYTTFENLINMNKNTFLKIEFFNLIIDDNEKRFFKLIEKEKHNKDMQNEYFFYYIYGKYYNKNNKIDLSNFYFCQFYKLINIKDKSDYYCNKYDIINIPKIDVTYALFK